LSLVVASWPSLSAGIRAALLAMVRACLEKRSDAPELD
jgi:hypothetical protein